MICLIYYGHVALWLHQRKRVIIPIFPMSEGWKLSQRARRVAICCQASLGPSWTLGVPRRTCHLSRPALSWPPLRPLRPHFLCSSSGDKLLSRASLELAVQPPGFGSKAFQRAFRRPSSSLADSDGERTLPATQQTVDKRIRNKVRNCAIGFGLILAWGFMVGNIPSWGEALDIICRFVPPKTVENPSVSVSPHSSTIHNPTHQDAPTRQPIVFPDELRVLMLEPGSGTDEVHCRLLNVTRSWRTRYDALSYTWGDEMVHNRVIVNGLRTSVTENLHSALVHLRHPSRPRMLWVDALCINQDDSEERDEQVARMGSIYSSARRVIIWLGEQDREVEGAFSLLGSLGRYLNLRATVEISGDWSPVLNLLRRPWFQRTWIIQEAVLARDLLVVCGLETIPFRQLSDCCESGAFQEMVPDDPLVKAALNSMNMIAHGRHEHHTKYVDRSPRRRGRLLRALGGRRRPRRRGKKYTPDFRLVGTLYETRGFQCKDLRDKVFGVLSMVLNVGSDDDVRKLGYGNNLEEVYETVARWDISKNKSLEVLSYCSRRSRTHPDLPSWVPDFSDMDEASPTSVSYGLKHPKGSNPGLEGEYRPSFAKKNGKTVLTVSGELVDTISSVGPVAEHSKMVIYTHPGKGENDPEAGADDIARPNLSALAKRRKWFEECVRIAQASDPVAHRDSPKRAARSFVESPTFGMSVYQFDQFKTAMKISSLSTEMYGYAKFLYKDIGVTPEWYKEWEGLGWNNDYMSMDQKTRKFSHKRRFCATRRGEMGWVPGAAREGDIVCLVSGAQVPIILRRTSLAGEADRYMVMGDGHFGGMRPRRGFFYIGGERLAII